MARKSTIGGINPLDMLIPPKPTNKAKTPPKKPAPAPKAEAAPRARLTIQIDGDVAERAKNAAYWDRVPLAQLVEEGLRLVVDKMERARGEVFEEREAGLRPGRPFKRSK